MRAKTGLFFIIDGSERTVSWSDKTESGEQFNTQRAAEKRAAYLAQTEPGKTFYVCSPISVVCAAVGPSVIAAVPKKRYV